jgi:mono/diheme cytochrome c family protein
MTHGGTRAERKRKRSIAAFAAGLGIAALLAAACGSPRRSEAMLGSMEIRSPEVARGRIVYARNCDECHPGGAAGLGPSLNNKPLPGFLIRFQVRHGMGAMPAFSEKKISDEDLDAVIEYVRARRAHD